MSSHRNKTRLFQADLSRWPKTKGPSLTMILNKQTRMRICESKMAAIETHIFRTLEKQLGLSLPIAMPCRRKHVFYELFFVQLWEFCCALRTLRNEFEGFKFRMENREVHILMAYLCTFCWNVQNIVKIEGKVIFFRFF